MFAKDCFVLPRPRPRSHSPTSMAAPPHRLPVLAWPSTSAQYNGGAELQGDFSCPGTGYVCNRGRRRPWARPASSIGGSCARRTAGRRRIGAPIYFLLAGATLTVRTGENRAKPGCKTAKIHSYWAVRAHFWRQFGAACAGPRDRSRETWAAASGAGRQLTGSKRSRPFLWFGQLRVRNRPIKQIVNA